MFQETTSPFVLDMFMSLSVSCVTWTSFPVLSLSAMSLCSEFVFAVFLATSAEAHAK